MQGNMAKSVLLAFGKMQMNSLGRNGWRWTLGGALMALAALAHAQYVWVDDKGLKQYSDRPPAPSVPLKRILKAPGLEQQQREAAAAAAAPEDGAAATPAPKAAPGMAELNADFRKRKAEEAEKERKAGEEARRKADISSNCESQRKNKLLLDSGRRISVTASNGEAGFMSDEERARQTRKAQQALADCP